MSWLCSGRLALCELSAEKCCVGPLARVPLALYGQLDFARLSSAVRGWACCDVAALVRKEQQKAVVEEQPAPCCRSPPFQQPNACFNFSHGNLFILRPVQRSGATCQGSQEPVQPCGVPGKAQRSRRDGDRFHACKTLCQLQNSGCWFPTQKRTDEALGEPLGILSWAAPPCRVTTVLGHQGRELRKEDGEPRSKEKLGKHEASVLLISASGTKEVPAVYQS